ncbi:MAG: AAA family ATPase [Chloroflexi bacterium]|nr:AAA family ATPase [Chloroflexota bacterium]
MMRLDRLALTRYGIFSDRVIDFGEPVQGESDFHLVYGPNESGKSTALAGFLDLLFAFQHRSPYGFAHGYDAMRVDADLNVGGAVRRLVRIRKRQGSLLDESGRPVSEDLLVNALGGMNRETYRAMFSLDDDSLEAGGEEILRSEGNLGQLLFATGAGLVELSETLNRLRDTAQGFYKPRSRGTHLHALKARLEELERERKTLDTAASAHARLAAKRDAAGSAYDEAMAQRARLEADREEARRRVDGLRQLAQIRPIRAEFANLGTLPEAPLLWFTQIGDLIADEPKLSEKVKGLRDQKRKLEEEQEALVLDEAILQLKDRLTSLDKGRARYVTAEDDLPRRRTNLAEHQGTIDAVVRRLNKAADTDPRTLVIPTGTVGVLNELIERRSGIEERLRASAEELEAASAAAATAAGEFAETSNGGDTNDDVIRRLNEVLEEIQSDDFAARLALHDEQCRDLKAQIDGQLAELHPWNGGAEALAGVHVPEQDEMQNWSSALDEVHREIERLDREKTRLAVEGRRLSQQAERRAAETGVVGDEDAEHLRALRNEAWTLHRAALDEESADAFEERLKDDDAATSGRIAHATGLAGLRQAAEALRNVESEIARNEEELMRARGNRQAVLDRIASGVAAMSRTGASDMPSDISLAKLSGWMERRAGILETLVRLDRENARIDRAQRDALDHRRRLSEALTGADLAHDPDGEFRELIGIARRALALHTERRTASAAASERMDRTKAELVRRQHDARRAGDDDAAWRQEWTMALSDSWLTGFDPPPATSAVRRILEEVSLLDSTLTKRDELQERVVRMERDQAAYAEETRGLVEGLGGEFDSERPVAQGDALKARLAAAVANQTSREGLSEKISALSEEITSVEAGLAELRALASPMFEAFGVNSLRAVDEKLQQVSRRNALREDLSKREAGLVEAMKAASLDAAETALADASDDDLENRIAETGARLADVSQRTQELYHQLETAKEEINAIGGDGAVARLEGERRTCLLDIQERTRDYVRTRIGIEAADRALQTYRDEHRSTMMKRASEAFRTISRGAYSRLESQLTDKGEVLLGIGAGGDAKIASQMSKGARFQLYLALRVAGYLEFVDQHGPVPFIADDILETSDDFRAREAFRVFADMAKVGQVIYLGHHHHLCDIAADVCPGVRLHELPDPLDSEIQHQEQE